MVQYFPVITGSLTVNGNLSVSGNVAVTGSLSGTSSLAANAELLSGTGSVGFTTTGSFTVASSSLSSRTTQIENVYATTGSNSFRATQSITGSLTVTGQIIAQTINVQQVTSSIVYSSGSNVFGCDINSRQTFTGSFYQTGSVASFSNNVGINGSPGTNFPLEAYINSSTTYSSTSRGNVMRVYNSNLSSDVYAGIELGGAGLSNDGLAGINGVVTGAGSGALTFYTRNSNTFGERMRIANNGLISINNTISSSNYKLGVSGSAYINGTNNKGIFVTDNANYASVVGLNSAISAYNALEIRASGTDYQLYLTTGGLVGIGTCYPAQALEVNGNIISSVSGKIGFRYSSTNGNLYSYLRSATNSGVGPIVLGGGFESGGGSNEAIRFVTNDGAGNERCAVSILNSGRVGIATTSPTTQFQIRKNYWQFWEEKTHNSNTNMFSITLPDFGAAVVTIAGSRYSPGADNYSGTSTYYIFITNVGAVSVNGGNTSGTWTPTTSVSSKTVTFASAYAGSSTNYTNYSAVIQGSGHNGGSESALTVTIL